MPPGRKVAKIKTTDDRQAKALELKEQGQSLSQIAAKRGKSVEEIMGPAK